MQWQLFTEQMSNCKREIISSLCPSSQSVETNCYYHSSLHLLFRERDLLQIHSLAWSGAFITDNMKEKSGEAWGMYVYVCTFLFLPLLHFQNPCHCCPSADLGRGPVLLLPLCRAWTDIFVLGKEWAG